MEAKPVSSSYAETRELIQPADLNVYGTLFGGHLVSLVDKIAGIAAYQHSRMKVVTISIDSLVFEAPALNGQILSLKAAVNRVFTSSMEVGVQVNAWDPHTDKYTRICPAYLTFVALDDKGDTQVLPQVIPETEVEKQRFVAAGIRRESRLALAKQLHSISKD